MYTRSNPNEAYIARQMWQQVKTRRIGILHELANKLLSEVENITGNGVRLHFGDGFRLREQMQKFEIRHALQLTNGKQSDAARMLGIKTTTLNVKIKRFQLEAVKSNHQPALSTKREK